MVDLQRLGLTARRVQRAHEQGPGTFGQRVGGQQRAELTHQAGSLAEGQVGLDPVGQHAGAQLGQPGRGRVGEVVPGPAPILPGPFNTSARRTLLGRF